MTLATRIMIVLAALGVIAGPALPDRVRIPGSITRSFTIDGRRFCAEDAGDKGFSLLDRELAVRGIRTASVSDNLSPALASGSIEPLREEPAKTIPFPLPCGLEPDHVLRLDTESGPVDIAFGRLVCGSGNLLGRLRSSGWECREADGRGVAAAVAELKKGKETSLVLLEKGDGRFLAIRRVVR